MRKLATAAISFSAAVFASNYLLNEGWMLGLLIACLILSALSGLFLRREPRLRCLLIFIAASVGFGVFYAGYQLHTVPAHSVDGEKLTVSATALDYPERYDDYSRLKVNITSDNAPKLRAYVYVYQENGAIPELVPGDTVEFTAELKASDVKRGEPYDLYTSNGIYLLCYVKDGSVRVTGRSATAFLQLPAVISHRLNEVAAQVFTDDTAAFLKALTTGYRFDLKGEGEVYSSIQQAGIAHVVAVSGMHVAFLVAFLGLILRRKKAVALVSLPIIWLFALVAGLTPSVFRAAVMQSAVLIAPLAKRENDGLTTLSAALALLLLINPDSCASVSLQMSFAAMVGIVVISPVIYDALARRISAKRKSAGNSVTRVGALGFRALDGMGAALAASVGAQAFTLPLTALYFGYIPLYSIIVNLLVLWVVSLAFILGLLACVAGLIWLPLGIVPGFAASLSAKVIIWLAKLFSGLPYAALYMENLLFLSWLVLVYIIVVLCWLMRGKRGFRAVIPTCLVLSSLCCVIIMNELLVRYGGASFAAIDVGQGQSLVITDKDASVVIDCGGNDAYRSAGDITAAYLLSRGRDTVDVLALTHFDMDHINGVTKLMGNMPVETLIIPAPDTEDERVAAVLEAADRAGSKVYIIDKDTTINAGGVALTAFTSGGGKELMLRCIAGDSSVFVSGDAYAEAEYRFLYEHEAAECDIYVVGHHGSEFAASDILLDALRPRAAVISSGYNTYGHPSPETLTRLSDRGIPVFRTDEGGNIIFTMEQR